MAAPSLYRDAVMASTPDHESVQVARLVRFCDAFNLPLVTLLLPGLDMSARSGSPAEAARALANLLFAYAEASTPKLTVLTAGAECRPIMQVGTSCDHSIFHAACTAH